MSLNNISIIGNLTRDAELKTSTNGLAVGRFSIAVNEYKKDEVSFFSVTCFGKQAETLVMYLKKGKQVGVTGRLKEDRWTDDSGQNRSKVVIIANDIHLLGGNEKSRANPEEGGW